MKKVSNFSNQGVYLFSGKGEDPKEKSFASLRRCVVLFW